MMQALKHRHKSPRQELCRWNSVSRKQPSIFDSTGFVPSKDEPVVYHLHGHDKLAESLVLTEDDYLDFLSSLARDQLLIPARIQEALTQSALLFIGYRLADWSFRVLF